ncbi:MAG: hypothetical protein AAGJ79_09740 [Verrucomicrobiota bacterium]
MASIGQVGFADGAGLGAGGDGVGVILDADMNGIDGGDSLIDSELYPEAAGFSGQSYDVELGGVFSTVGNGNGAVATLITGGTTGGEPAIGSPFSIVPEPTSAVLGLLGFALIFRRRNSR